jgi:D-alanyl-D-alanine dipeptidase
LVDAMERHGFVNYEKEWWHFSLLHELEPYRTVFFDFPVQ